MTLIEFRRWDRIGICSPLPNPTTTSRAADAAPAGSTFPSASTYRHHQHEPVPPTPPFGPWWSVLCGARSWVSRWHLVPKPPRRVRFGRCCGCTDSCACDIMACAIRCRTASAVRSGQYSPTWRAFGACDAHRGRPYRRRAAESMSACTALPSAVRLCIRRCVPGSLVKHATMPMPAGRVSVRVDVPSSNVIDKISRPRLPSVVTSTTGFPGRIPWPLAPLPRHRPWSLPGAPGRAARSSRRRNSCQRWRMTIPRPAFG